MNDGNPLAIRGASFTYSVTFTTGDASWSVPFTNRDLAESYAENIRDYYAVATNVTVNDLRS
jgi:hypothetical protein